MNEAKMDGWRARSDAALLDCYMMGVEEIADLLLEEAEALSVGHKVRQEVLDRVAAGALQENGEEGGA